MTSHWINRFFDLFKTPIGRLRILGFLEGTSLLALILIAVPLKYVSKEPALSQTLGPVHGVLFLLFVLNAISVGIQQMWKIKTNAIILASCFIPFGTFYVDHKFLKNIN